MLQYTMTVARGLQVPLLATLLIGGSMSKMWRGSSLAQAGLFPWRLRRPVATAISGAELFLGVLLLVTAGSGLSGMPATLARTGTALFFFIATGTLYEVRQRRPEAGCGCFGDLSETPIGVRAIARAALLGAAALISIRAPVLHMPSSSGRAWLWLGVVALELALLVALSPEVGEILIRLGYSEPCELRRVPVARTLATLRASSAWRKHASQLLAITPADVWREGCWRFVVFPGLAEGRRVDVVFAVYLQQRHPPIRTAVLDAATSEVLASAAL